MEPQIKDLLAKLGRTQRELADAAGVSVAAISRYSCGLSVPTPAVALQIATFLRVSVESLNLRSRHRRGRRTLPGQLNQDAFKKALKKRGINTAELARQVGITRQAMSAYYAGRNLPRAATLQKIGEVLDIEPAELLEPAEEESATSRPVPIPMRPRSSQQRQTSKRQ